MKSLHDYYKFLKAIPSKHWCKHRLTSSDGLKHCVRGHLGTRRTITTVIESPEALEFYKLLKYDKIAISNINDGVDPKFKQPRPKSRILAFIKSKL